MIIKSLLITPINKIYVPVIGSYTCNLGYGTMNRLCICLCVLFISIPAIASHYSPPGLYDVDYFTLENGLIVVLNQRKESHKTAIRLVVNVGTYDFPHGKKETPHFLEHLLFTGTSKHSQEELEKIIESYGGTWNAGTGLYDTTYEIDIYSSNTFLALDILFEIISDSTISPEKVKLSREIIYRESGGKPSTIRQWLFKRGIGKSANLRAIEALLPDNQFLYLQLETAEDISQDEIIQTYKTYYVPNNMALIIVGKFDKESVIEQIRSTFGSLPKKTLNRKEVLIPPYPSGPTEVRGTFSPIIDTEGVIGVAFRTNGLMSPDYHALYVLESYLNTRLYESIRVEKGLSYSPAVDLSNYEYYGCLSLMADVDINNMDAVLDIIRKEISALIQGKIQTETFERAKQGILLRTAQGYETNSDKADYYAATLHELKAHGALIYDEQIIENITNEQR